MPNIRGFYGMSLFSCAACDGWELRDQPLAPHRADARPRRPRRLVARWSDNLIVFTHGADVVDAADEAELAASGIRVIREPITELVGSRGALSGVALSSARQCRSRAGSCARCGTRRWSSSTGWMPLATRTGISPPTGPAAPASQDCMPRGMPAAPGPQQLIVAAGQGARAAAVIIHDTVGVVTAH